MFVPSAYPKQNNTMFTYNKAVLWVALCFECLQQTQKATAQPEKACSAVVCLLGNSDVCRTWGAREKELIRSGTDGQSWTALCCKRKAVFYLGYGWPLDSSTFTVMMTDSLSVTWPRRREIPCWDTQESVLTFFSFYILSLFLKMHFLIVKCFLLCS